MDEIKTQFSVTKDGQGRVDFDLTPHHFESLKMLANQDAWKLYRKLLIQAKEGYFLSVLTKNEAIPMAKTAGMVSGINFAINQLPVLIGMYEAQQKKKIAEAERKEKNLSES